VEVVVEMDAVMRCSDVHMAGRQEKQQEGGGGENGCYGNAQWHAHSKEVRWITVWQGRREWTLWQCAVVHAWQWGEGNSRRAELAGVDVVARCSGVHGREEARRAGWWGGSGNGCFYEMQWCACRREVGKITAEWIRQKWTLWRSTVVHMWQGSKRGNRMIDEVGLDDMARHSGMHAAGSQ
jgi:hypothetical protein